MATTTYTVTAAGEARATKTKKQVAIDLAVSIRDAERVGVSVTTQAGTVVFEAPAPKKIKMSAPYTRDVPVDAENVETIDGARVAYKRTRVGFALLDRARGAYEIWDLVHHRSVGEIEVSTTRDAGRFFADDARALRAELELANA